MMATANILPQFDCQNVTRRRVNRTNLNYLPSLFSRQPTRNAAWQKYSREGKLSSDYWITKVRKKALCWEVFSLLPESHKFVPLSVFSVTIC